MLSVTALIALIITTHQAVKSRDSTQQRLDIINGPIPIVVWHGIGLDRFHDHQDPFWQQFLEHRIEGVYVKPIVTGSSARESHLHKFFMDANDQVTVACDMIRNDSRLRDGYHGVGLSQGGLFLRAVAQRCPRPRMRSLVTIATPHQGINGLPLCPETFGHCNYVRRLLNLGAYTTLVQRSVTQAQFWHDPLNEDTYRAKSVFLADINNERIPRKVDYVENLNRLKNFVMVQFDADNVIVPTESESFGWYVPGQTKVTQGMTETTLYREDWIGLRRLDEAGRVKVYKAKGTHLKMDMEWFASEILEKYLH